MTISDRIVADSRVQKMVELDGGRMLVRIPTHLIKEHPKLSKIRDEDPKIERLQESIKQTGGTPVYPPLIYAEWKRDEGESEERVHYYIADGHQRLRAAKAAKLPDLVVQVVVRWTNADEAFNECVSIQYARFEMKDADLFSILREGKLTDQELIRYTGKSESTIGRMRKVCHQPLLVQLITEHDAISTNVAARLMDKCDNNPTKLEALIASMTKKLEEAEKKAGYYKSRYTVQGEPKKQQLKDLAKVKTYFKDVKWNEWEDAIEKVKKGNTELALDKDKTPEAKAKVEVSDATEIWQEQIPIYFHGSQKHSEMSVKNLRDFRDSLSMIGEKLDAIIRQRQVVDAAKEHPIPPSNPVVDIPAPPKPQSQSTDMKVEE